MKISVVGKICILFLAKMSQKSADTQEKVDCLRSFKYSIALTVFRNRLNSDRMNLWSNFQVIRR